MENDCRAWCVSWAAPSLLSGASLPGAQRAAAQAVRPVPWALQQPGLPLEATSKGQCSLSPNGDQGSASRGAVHVQSSESLKSGLRAQNPQCPRSQAGSCTGPRPSPRPPTRRQLQRPFFSEEPRQPRAPEETRQKTGTESMGLRTNKRLRFPLIFMLDSMSNVP